MNHYFKNLAREIATNIAASDALWHPISRSLVRGSQYLCSVRDNHEAEQIILKNPRLKDAFESRLVQSGPFKGMKYESIRAHCSSLYPKILGTYEHEISSVVEEGIRSEFGTVVDVGAADGYYAVGLALAKPKTKIIAFEQNALAQAELAKLADANGVADRVEIRGKCSPHDLMGLDPRRGLMIVDCEGYEDELLSDAVIQHFKEWDFIIETHDGYVPDVTKRLIARFSMTHEAVPVEAIHDFNKADVVQLPILEGLPRKHADKLLAEGRQHACLRWLACYSKSHPRTTTA